MRDSVLDSAMTEPGDRAPPPYPAEKARGGEIILRTPLRRRGAGGRSSAGARVGHPGSRCPV